MTKAHPADAASASTRQRILAAARELFAEMGYSAASISKIAARAGVLAGSIYWAFESKEKLFAEALTQASDEWGETARFSANDRRIGVATLREDLTLLAGTFADGPEFLRLLMVVATEHQASSPEILAAAAAVRRMWRETLEQGLMADLAAYDPEAALALVQRISRLVLQLLDGVFMSLQIERDQVSAQALIAEAADLAERELSLGVGRLPRG